MRNQSYFTPGIRDAVVEAWWSLMKIESTSNSIRWVHVESFIATATDSAYIWFSLPRWDLFQIDAFRTHRRGKTVSCSIFCLITRSHARDSHARESQFVFFTGRHAQAHLAGISMPLFSLSPNLSKSPDLPQHIFPPEFESTAIYGSSNRFVLNRVETTKRCSCITSVLKAFSI